MALMINYGTIASWKIRSLTVARQQLWGYSSHHSLKNMPRPDFWPDNAQMGNQDLDNLAVPAGPSLACATYALDVFDTTSGPREGNADLTRPFPLLGSQFPSYSLHASTMTQDHCGQYSDTEMSGDTMLKMVWNDPIYESWPFSYGQMVHHNRMINDDLRIPLIMRLPWALATPSSDLVVNAAEGDKGNSVVLLSLLRRDPEDMAFRAMFPGPPPDKWRGLPNFHPMLGNFCSTDPDTVQERVDNLIEAIEAVPQNMSDGFRGMYQFVLNHYSQALQGLNPMESQQLQAEISILQENISFLSTFPP
jgi:hypothetical protein